MRRGVVLVCCVAVCACSDAAAPSVRLDVRIIGPEAALPGDSLFLAGSATDPVTGAVPDSALFWSLPGDSIVRGATLALVMPATGAVTVALTAQSASGRTGQATRTVTLPPAGVMLWQEPITTGASTLLAYSPADRAVYVASSLGVLAIARSKSVRWHSDRPLTTGTVAIGPDGTMYVPWSGVLGALSADGSETWEVRPDAQQIAVRRDGTVVVVTPTGTLNWLTPAGDRRRSDAVAPRFPSRFTLAISRDGYAWITVREYRQVYARVIDGTTLATLNSFLLSRWGGPCAAPTGIVASTGRLMLLATQAESTCAPGTWLHAIDLDGYLLWTYRPPGFTIQALPAVGSDGMAYFGLSTGAVVAVGFGSERWRSPAVVPACSSPAYSSATPAIGADGTVFHHAGGRVVAVDGASGTIKWSAPTVPDTTANACGETIAPLLTSDGWLFTITGPAFTAGSAFLSAFAAGTVADSMAPWGQDRSDERRSGQGH